MSTFWKVFAALAVLLPLGAFVAGSMIASAADAPAPRQTLVVEDSGTPTPAPASPVADQTTAAPTTPTPTPAPPTPAPPTPTGTPSAAPTQDDHGSDIPRATQHPSAWGHHGRGDDHGHGWDDHGDDHGGRGHGGGDDHGGGHHGGDD
jgi:hypothetical protein